MTMSLTKEDLAAISELIDQRLERGLKLGLVTIEQHLFSLERRLTNVEVRLERVEGEQIATRADIKELYTLAAS